MKEKQKLVGIFEKSFTKTFPLKFTGKKQKSRNKKCLVS
jgi:hypothetical protein